MQYNELDLDRLIPNGAPLNEDAEVIPKGAINAFFLRGFEAWYADLEDMAAGASAPFSLAGCMACSNDELNRFLAEYGAEAYDSLEHGTKARFVHSLATTGLGTQGIIDAIIKYVFNSSDVTGQAVYDGCAPHYFKIHASGDIMAADLTDLATTRLIDNLDKFNLCTEKLNGLTYTQQETNEAIYIANPANSAMQLIRVNVQGPLYVGQPGYIANPTGSMRIGSPYWWAYGFRSGSIGNMWNPEQYARQLLTNESSGTAIPNAQYLSVVIRGNNGAIVNMSDYPQATYFMRVYSSRPEFYTTGLRNSGVLPLEPTIGTGSAVIVLPASTGTIIAPQITALPTNLYIIDGNSLAWNSTHPLYELLEGVQVTIM